MRQSVAESLLSGLPMLAAVMLLASVLAYWTWVVVAPRPRAPAPAIPEQRAPLEHAYGLFGTPRSGADAPAATGVAVKLLGVAAAQGGRHGYAVVLYEGNHILAVPQGEEIAPGVRVAEVHPDRVILERSGTRETLQFPQKTGAPAPKP